MLYFKLVFKSTQNFEELPSWAEKLEHKLVVEHYEFIGDQETWKVRTFQTMFFESEKEMRDKIARLTEGVDEYEDEFDVPTIVWSGKCIIPENVEIFAADRARACWACGEFGFESRRRIRKEAREQVKNFARSKQEERDFLAFLNWKWDFQVYRINHPVYAHFECELGGPH